MRPKMMNLICALGVLSFSVGNMEAQTYKEILIKRDGGGNKVFAVTLDSSARLVSFHITQYDFKKADYFFSRSVDSLGTLAGVIEDILSGNTNIKGDLAHSSRPTGTWLRVYAVTTADSLDEITDRTVRDRLKELEQCVEDHRRMSGH